MEPTASNRLTVENLSDDEDDAAFDLPPEYVSLEDLDDPNEDEVDGGTNYAQTVSEMGGVDRPPPIVGVFNRVTKLSREFSGYAYMPEEASSASPIIGTYYAELPNDTPGSSSSTMGQTSPRIPPIVLPKPDSLASSTDSSAGSSIALPLRAFLGLFLSESYFSHFFFIALNTSLFLTTFYDNLASPKPQRVELSQVNPAARDWNEEFQRIIGEPISKSRFEKLSSLTNDFCYAAKQYGKIIISFSLRSSILVR